jgi:hypothetical protein
LRDKLNKESLNPVEEEEPKNEEGKKPDVAGHFNKYGYYETDEDDEDDKDEEQENVYWGGGDNSDDMIGYDKPYLMEGKMPGLLRINLNTDKGIGRKMPGLINIKHIGCHTKDSSSGNNSDDSDDEPQQQVQSKIRIVNGPTDLFNHVTKNSSSRSFQFAKSIKTKLSDTNVHILPNDSLFTGAKLKLIEYSKDKWNEEVNKLSAAVTQNSLKTIMNQMETSGNIVKIGEKIQYSPTKRTISVNPKQEHTVLDTVFNSNDNSLYIFVK